MRLAQLDRAFGYGPKGRGFESSNARSVREKSLDIKTLFSAVRCGRREYMSKQEFLDRKDEYEMTFFLEGGKWIYTEINILDWRLVVHNYGLN